MGLSAIRALCGKFNRAIRRQLWMPNYIKSDNHPLYRFHQSKPKCVYWRRQKSSPSPTLPCPTHSRKANRQRSGRRAQIRGVGYDRFLRPTTRDLRGRSFSKRQTFAWIQLRALAMVGSPGKNRRLGRSNISFPVARIFTRKTNRPQATYES
jgi:hypothetical protein